MMRSVGRSGLCGLVIVALLAGGCSGSGADPDVAAFVEGTEIPASETEALLDGHLKAQLAQQDAAADGHAVDEDRTETLTSFVLLYQIKHALLRHLAREMGVSAESGGTPEAEAGRLSHAMAERLFPDVAAPQGEPDKATAFVDAQRQGLFTEWFDKQLRLADVRVDKHFGRWDAERGVVVQ